MLSFQYNPLINQFYEILGEIDYYIITPEYYGPLTEIRSIRTAQDMVLRKTNLIDVIGSTPGIYDGSGITGLIDGVNDTFITPVDFVLGTTKIYVGGLRLSRNQDYEEVDSHTIRIFLAPESGANLIAEYVTLI